MYKVLLKKKAEKELRKLPITVLTRIASAIDDLSVNPRPEGSKKLKGSDDEIWRVRVGDYRIIYVISDEIRLIDIRKIGHRKDVYKS